MPNTLDFDVVFKEFGRLDETGNVAVLSAISVALLLYLLVVIFGRRADKRDKAKVKSRDSSFRCKLVVQLFISKKNVAKLPGITEFSRI